MSASFPHCFSVSGRRVSCGLSLAAALLGACSTQEDAAPGSVTQPTAGGSPDADTGADANAEPGCPPASFCDDFEAFATGSTPGGAWTPNLGGGSVVVDEQRAFRGSKSVLAKTFATAVSGETFKSAFIGLSRPPVVPVAAFYGRMMFYLLAAPASEVHWNMILGSGPVPGQGYSAIYGYGGQRIVDGGSQLLAAYDTPDFYSTPSVGPHTDCYQHAAGTLVPVGRWACAQWYFDSRNAELRFWLDGVEVPELTVEGSGQGCLAQDASYRWTGPTFMSIEVGWQSYQADDERSIWIDDVAIGPEELGCPAPAQ